MPRVFTAHTPLGDSLLFHSLHGHEEMSRLFDCQLQLVSLDSGIAMNAILGQSLTVEVQQQGGSRRYLNGYAVEFAQIERDGRYHRYEARLRPQLWHLTNTRDFKIYQKMTARDIVKDVLGQFGIAFRDQLTGYYRQRDYTVCYGESYFDFISRLLEEEGAGYWFEHSPGSHVMVLCDSISAYPILPGYASIPYYSPNLAATPNEDHVHFWGIGQTVNPGQYSARDYDFKKPKANLEIVQPKPRDHPHSHYETYAYPGGYRDAGDGDHYARMHIEALQTRHERASAHSNVRGIAPGHRFTLTRCHRDDQNREYLIVRADYSWIESSYEIGNSVNPTLHNTSFVAQPSSEPYRPERITPYPVAHATDSAIVTGPAGEEIWTDEHGRVKVHFHWDRYGSKDENSSCWVRVSQPWAGANFGMMHIPRIGQEVLIGYVDNNPDHPVITSRLYNADTMPPWGLPANATQSGILTRSTKGGGYDNANAIRFEDKKGEEQLWLHAEKDQLTEVEHDEDKWVGNDRRKTIDRDETNHIKRDRIETVDRDETITVHGKRTEVVDGNEDITIHSNRTERVDHNETISIGDNQKLTVGSNRTKTVQANENNSISRNQSTTIGMIKTETVKLMSIETVGIAKMSTYGAGYMLNVGAGWMSNIGFIHNHTVGTMMKTSVGNIWETKVGGGSGGGGESAGGAPAGGKNIVAPAGGGEGGGGGGGGGGGSQIRMDDKGNILLMGKGTKILMDEEGVITIKAKKIIIDGAEIVDVDGKLIDLN